MFYCGYGLYKAGRRPTRRDTARWVNLRASGTRPLTRTNHREDKCRGQPPDVPRIITIVSNFLQMPPKVRCTFNTPIFQRR